jgi:dTDP-4-dehydrorhamnose reductase
VNIGTFAVSPQGSRFLVLGASGLLGSRVFDALKIHSRTFGTYLTNNEGINQDLIRIDLSSIDSLTELIDQLSPTHIINCFGLTDVEVCEARPEACWKANAEIPILISKISLEREIRFTHISTDHFQSNSNSPRDENQTMIPINQYGFAKFHAEKSILLANPNTLVLRTNFFGHSRNGKRSLLDFALGNLMSNRPLDGFDDVFFSPVGINQIAKFLVLRSQDNIQGLVNFGSSNSITKYDFLVMIAESIGAPTSLIRRSSISSSTLKVKRPDYLALDSSLLLHEFGYEVPSLREMLSEELQGVL